MPLLSLESAVMLCRVDPRGRLGLLFRRRVGPLLLRAGGREPCLLPLHAGGLLKLISSYPGGEQVQHGVGASARTMVATRWAPVYVFILINHRPLLQVPPR